MQETSEGTVTAAFSSVLPKKDIGFFTFQNLHIQNDLFSDSLL